MNIVGRFVKLARDRHEPRLTQDNLATRLQLLGWNCDRFTISKIELGTRQITDKEVLLLSKALNVSADWLLGKEE
jgi:transcriptional regulator with XRE-family HTH domain